MLYFDRNNYPICCRKLSDDFADEIRNGIYRTTHGTSVFLKYNRPINSWSVMVLNGGDTYYKTHKNLLSALNDFITKGKHHGVLSESEAMFPSYWVKHLPTILKDKVNVPVNN